MVMVMDKAEYLQLLRKSSVDKTDKFVPASLERPKAKGRPQNVTTLYFKERKLMHLRSKRFYQKSG